jgi:hypothetical protein
MVSIQLKSKEFLLIAYNLFSEPSNQSFSLLDRIKSATNGKEDDDLTIVSASKDEVITIYKKLTNQSEGVYNQINDSMFTQLQSQMADGIASNEDEWIEIANKISIIREDNLSKVDVFISYIKEKFA